MAVAGARAGIAERPMRPGRRVAAPPAAEATSTPAPELDLPALESRLAAVRGAWAEALKAAETAVAAAARADAGESAWAAAELQLSRLERAAVPFGEIAEALGGSESGAALRAATEAERARHLEAFARLRAALRR